MKRAVMYGAGNIGRGFIGLLFSQSGYDVAFLDINMEVIDRLNADRQYPVTIVSNDGNREVTVKNVRGVDSRNTDNVIDEILNADVMATAVGVNVLRFIAEPIAKGLSARFAAGKKPLNIFLCENLIDADKFLKNEIFKYLSEEDKAKFDTQVGLVEASIGRMVPVLKKEPGANPLSVSVEEFDILHLDKRGFRGEIPAVKNVILCEPFNMYIQRKLFIHNMCHAICAYLGAIRGYEYISEAISDIEIKTLVVAAGMESARAIAYDNKVDLNDLIDFLNKLMYRFNNEGLRDTVARVGRDPVRKIKLNDRITGAYKLAEKYNVCNVYIAVGIAALTCFKRDDDPASLEIADSIEKVGLKETILKYSGAEFTDEEIALVEKFREMLLNKDIKSVIFAAEKYEASKIVNK